MAQLALGGLLFKLALHISLLVLHALDEDFLLLDVTFGLDAPLDSRLYLIAILLEKAQLLHQLVLFKDDALVVGGQLVRVFATDLQLRLQLAHFLRELIAFELTTGRAFNLLVLTLSR